MKKFKFIFQRIYVFPYVSAIFLLTLFCFALGFSACRSPKPAAKYGGPPAEYKIIEKS